MWIKLDGVPSDESHGLGTQENMLQKKIGTPDRRYKIGLRSSVFQKPFQTKKAPLLP